MNDITKKVQTAQNLYQIASYAAKINTETQGWQLPCKVVRVIADNSGNTPDGLVEIQFQVNSPTNAFPNVIVPVVGWRYIRYPIQVGDAGITITIDVDTQNIAGLVSGIASFTPSGNLGPTLAFLPIMQTTMANSDNPQAVVIVGPEGVILRDDAGDSVVTISPTGIRLQSGSSYISIAKNGAIDIEGTAVTIMGRDFVGHEHKNVQSGTSNTGGVV